MGEILLGDAGACVPHRQTHAVRLLAAGERQRDRAAVGELDAVAQQVEKDLAQLLPIARHRRRHAVRDRELEGEVLLPRAPLHEHHDVLDQLVQVEDGVLHLDLPGLDT